MPIKIPPIREAIIEVARNLDRMANCEFQTAQKHALNVLVGDKTEIEVEARKACEAHGASKAYQQAMKMVDQLRIRLEQKEISLE